MNGGAQSEFERVKNSIQPAQKNLMDEQSKLAEIRKYQVMALQNIQISQKTHNLLKQHQIKQFNEKDKDKKD